MKRGTPDHPKTKRFARLLCGGDIAKACGHLELLWHWTAQFARDGAIGQYDDEEIAEGMKWTGNASELILCLVESGFVDESPEWRLVIHDWYDHADDATHMAMARNHEWFAGGIVPKLSRFSSKDKDAFTQYYATHTPPAPATHTVHMPCTRNTQALPSPPLINLPSEDSSEPGKPATEPVDQPSAFTFPTVGKGPHTWTLPQPELERYRESFPSLDVEAEFRLARRWCETNPQKRKTASGMLRFLTTWLSTAQNRGNGKPPPKQPEPDPEPFMDTVRRQRP